VTLLTLDGRDVHFEYIGVRMDFLRTISGATGVPDVFGPIDVYEGSQGDKKFNER
jgi:hypothetical protein